jgi:3-oxoadipate enol-lactonase
VTRLAAASRFVAINGVTIGYSESGAGQTVVYAHGLSSSRAAVARASLSDFSILDEQFRYVSYDARGHGESTGTSDPADYSWASLADDLIELIDFLSPDAPVMAIGTSMGTGTILHAALTHPDRFDRLILTAPPTAWATRALQTRIYAERAAAVERNPESADEIFAAAPTPPIFRDLPADPRPPDVQLSLFPTIMQGAGLSDLPPADELRTIAQPTLILAWATDPGHPIDTADKLHDLMPDSRLHISTTSDDIRSWGDRAVGFLSE